MKYDELFEILENLDVQELTANQRKRLFSLSKKFLKTCKPEINENETNISINKKFTANVLIHLATLINASSHDDEINALKSIVREILKSVDD